MKKALVGIMSLLLAFSAFSGCAGAGDTPRGEDVLLDITPKVEEGYMELQVNQSNGLKTEG